MDEIVETSDPEELEELHAAWPRKPSPIRPCSKDGRQSPRKRPKLHHEYTDTLPRTPPRSPSLPTSPLFQSTPDYTSPASLTSGISPKASSPVATPPDPSISPNLASYGEEEPLASQDPLLLGGSRSPKPRVALQNTVLRASRSPSPRHDDPGSLMIVDFNRQLTPSRSRSRSLSRSRAEAADLAPYGEGEPLVSQDPLLLGGSRSPKPRVARENTVLRASRSPSPRHDDPGSLMIVDSNRQLTPSPSRSRSLSRSRAEAADPLFLFSPSRPSANFGPIEATPSAEVDEEFQAASQRATALSSPLSPPPRRKRTPPHPDPSDSPPSAQSSRSPQTPDDALAQPQSHYNFRHREEKQERPYEWDRRNYKGLFRRLPEAIVRNPSPRRHQRREEDYEDDQTQAFEEPDNDVEERTWADDLLPALPSSDEEVDETRRAGKKLEKEKKQGTKVVKPSKKKAKPFPLVNNDWDGDNAPKSPSHRLHATMDPLTRRVSQKSSSHRLPKRTSASPISPAPRPTPVFHNARSISPPTFRDDSDVDMPEHVSVPPSPDVQQQNDRNSPIIVADDEDDDEDEDEDEDEDGREGAEGSEPEVLSREEKKNRRRLRALKRMYPAFMREKMMKEAPPAKTGKRRRSPSPEGTDEEQPLLPGKTRVRRAENPRDLRDIKGDTESSDDEQVVPKRDAEDSEDRSASGDSDVEVVWHRQTHPRRRRERVRGDVSNSDEEIVLNVRIDDQRIENYLKEADVYGSGLHEKDMIDWMLDNTVEVGGTRPTARTQSNKPAKVARTKGSRRPNISISVGGARRERQQLLSFEKKPKRGRSRDRRPADSPPSSRRAAAAPTASRDGRNPPAVRQTVLILNPNLPQRSQSRPRRPRSSHSSPERASANNVRFDDPSPSPAPAPYPRPNETVHNIPDAEMARKAAKKLQDEERRARMKRNGVYVLPAPKGIRIVGQRSKAVAINVADQAFHRGLAPKSDKRPDDKRPRAPARLFNPTVGRVKSTTEPSGASAKRRLLPRGDRPQASGSVAPEVETRQESDGDDDDDGNPQEMEVEARPRDVVLDFGLPLRPSVTFSAQSTYIGKGYLSELVNPPDQAARPQFFSAHGFDLGPNVPIETFLIILDSICDRFFDFATGLPEDDDEEQVKEWSGLIRVTCHLVSYLAAGGETDPLKAAVEKHVLRLTSKMREASLTSGSMDATTFAICWFAVELAVRAGFYLPAQNARLLDSPNVLQEACTVLIEHLLAYGLERGMESLITQGEINGSTIEHRTFEMWIGLWHITHKYRHPTSTPKDAHPLWKMVQTALVARQTSDLDASEYAWRAIISLSTVSQISEMGKVTAAPTIPRAGWEIVLFALERIRLEADEQVDKTMSASSFEDLGRYIKLVVQRCCLLWSRWDWGLDGAFGVLRRLADIFRSRKFANLVHEKAEFPDFLRLNDWTMLSRPIHSETTFVLFLKLVYQTLLVTPTQVKKLLSVSAPLGSLPWSKETPRGSLDELSMLFNRFTFTAIAIHIDPKNHGNPIQRARGCVKFKDVDPTTRLAHIRGFMYLSIVMVQRDVPLDESISWLDEMVLVLLEEYKRRPDPPVVLGIHALVVSVRNIIRAFKGNPPEIPHRYPDPRLILSLERILRDASIVKPTNASAHIVPRLIRSFLTVRALTVPEPRRPVHSTQEESQDEYAALDFDDALIAALEEADGGYKAQDASLCKLTEESLIWTLFRQIGTYSAHLKKSANSRVAVDMASLIACWVGCGDILVRNSEKSWPAFLHAYPHRDWKLEPFSRRRMDFMVYSQVLKLDPMSYSVLRDAFMKIFFESLVSWHTTSEDEYIKLLLAIDGCQHPLLVDVSWNPEVAKDAPPVDLLTARLPLIMAILENLRQSLADPGASDNSSYVGYSIAMFAAMKNIHSELNKSDEAQGAYGAWCLLVHRELQNHAIFGREERLEQYIAWGRRLNDSVPN
ncbi:Mus7/MMS22 family-domain-containing protein [Mycena metata]|uniref:Mus7/MMS22 family-domain-containing protein n=1 Tax=Mycena metata TaxID=1033252 RepID=A0AAD7IHE8_9AGAR|nr:Mus7/MMS22 family-domain-containing protein [Mycena metata]